MVIKTWLPGADDNGYPSSFVPMSNVAFCTKPGGQAPPFVQIDLHLTKAMM